MTLCVEGSFCLSFKNLKINFFLFIPCNNVDVLIGGWVNPAIVNYFADYADMMFQEYGSKVKLTFSTYV